MIPLQLLIIAFLSLDLRSTNSQHHQYYDQTPCSSDTTNPATSYTCTTAGTSCRTFIVYRANHRFSTVSTISNLFQTDSHSLVSVNPNVSTPAQPLQPGHEVLVPITCSCSADLFYHSYFTYTAAINTSISEIACAVYEGMVKSVTLAVENHARGNDVSAGSTLRLPLKCACLEHVSSNDEVIKYLVTYPFIEGDSTPKLAKKFNVPVEEIWKFNRMDPFEPTVFPNTTVLVPLRDDPFINFSIPDSDPPTPQFLPTKPFEKERNTPELTKLYVAGSVVGTILIIALTISCCLYMKALKKFKNERIRALNSCSTPISSPFSGPPTRSSTNSCLSPDLLVGVKYSLRIYGVEEINAATKNFSDEVKTSGGIYRCSGEAMMIKEMRFEGTRQVIDVHSRINHVNIVKLRGVCYGDEHRSCCYLVFELPSNGSLRECLKRSSGTLQWHRRTQIAFDIATGLHYLHYSVTPAAYRDQLRLSSANIYLSSSWRAKILVSGDNLRSSGAEENVDRSGEIFAFGVVLMEVIGGKEAAVDERGVRETMTFMGANEGGCFDQLRSFVDPRLKDDYPLAEALCLAVLAGSCVDHDPMHRPSMEDVLKILARMV